MTIIQRLRNPPLGTETSERNLMAQAAAEIQRLQEAVQERDGVIEMILLRELRLREALEEIASLPDVRSDEAALIARKALA